MVVDPNRNSDALLEVVALKRWTDSEERLKKKWSLSEVAPSKKVSP